MSKNWEWKSVFGGMVLLLLSSFIAQRVLLRISEVNYPGGYAFLHLHELGQDIPVASVHIDTKAAMTGVSRFGETNFDWKYSKEENLSVEELQQFTFLLSENKTVKGFTLIGEEEGFVGLQFSHFPHIFRFAPEIFLHQRSTLEGS